MTQGVEEGLDVRLQHPAASHVHRRLPERLHRVVRRASRAEAVRAGQEVLLVHGLQDHRDRPLEELVLEGRDPDRPSLATVTFRDVDPLHGRRSVAARLQATQQRVQILIQVRAVVAARLAIHSDRSVLPGASVGFAEKIRVDVVGERRHHHRR